jgi:hypothetical protein
MLSRPLPVSTIRGKPLALPPLSPVETRRTTDAAAPIAVHARVIPYGPFRLSPYHHFSTTTRIGTVWAALLGAIVASGGEVYVARSEKGKVAARRGELDFRGYLWSGHGPGCIPGCYPRLIVVELTLRRGATREWAVLYRKIVRHMSEHGVDIPGTGGHPTACAEASMGFGAP